MYIERPILPSARVPHKSRYGSLHVHESYPLPLSVTECIDELEYVHGVNFHRTKRRNRCIYREHFHGTNLQWLVALREFSWNENFHGT